MDTIDEHFSLERATAHEIEKYVSRRQAIFEELNNKAVAAGRAKPFNDTTLAARTLDLIPTPSGGYKIVKRTKPIQCVDDDIGAISMLRVITREAGGLNKSINRGKYNDSMRLIGEDTASISLNELQGDGSGNFY